MGDEEAVKFAEKYKITWTKVDDTIKGTQQKVTNAEELVRAGTEHLGVALDGSATGLVMLGDMITGDVDKAVSDL